MIINARAFLLLYLNIILIEILYVSLYYLVVQLKGNLIKIANENIFYFVNLAVQ
jgi:hypothetical protein